MSRHEGVSCDSCLKGNFRGRRYKCLICYDYDLCSTCYESGAATTHHTSTHPMQCILTRADHDLFYGGEAVLGSSHDSPQSYTCPFCARLGFTETTLIEHVSSLHGDATQEVVCPICAAMPGGDPNHVTTDFSAHLTLEHRSGPRDLISFLDEPSGPAGRVSAGVRRVPHSRGVGGTSRARRIFSRSANVHNSNQPPQAASATLASNLSPSSAAIVTSRDSIDPIAELLSQLSGVRRSAPSSSASQLQQLQMQLERQQAHAQRLEQRAHQISSGSRMSGRPGLSATAGSSGGTATLSSHNTSALSSGVALGGHHYHPFSGAGRPNPASAALGDIEGRALMSTTGANPVTQSQFLLRQSSEEDDSSSNDTSKATKKSQFVQELVLSTLLLRQVAIGDEKVKKDPELS